MSVVRTAIVLDGQCEEQFWPYRGDTPTPAPSPPPTTIYKADAGTSLAAIALATIRNELAEGRPPVLVINPNAAFMQGQSPIVATATDPADGFLHALLAVGYDDGVSTLTVRNSWGSSWGKAGYADVTYDFLSRRGRFVMTLIV